MDGTSQNDTEPVKSSRNDTNPAKTTQMNGKTTENDPKF